MHQTDTAPEPAPALRRFERLSSVALPVTDHVRSEPLDPEFALIARLAKKLLGTPFVVISWVDAECVGSLGALETNARAVSHELTRAYPELFTREVAVIADTWMYAGLAERRVVISGQELRFCAASAIHTPEGFRVGTLCAFDTEPRDWGPSELESLQDLAALVEERLTHRTAVLRLEAEGAERRRFESVVRSLPIAVFSTDAEGACTYTNHVWRTISGIAREAMHGESWLSVVHAEDRERARTAWLAAAEAQVAFESVCRVARPNGAVRSVGVKAAPVFDNGRVVGWVGIAEDLTETRATQSALAESEARFRELANASDEVFWIADIDSGAVLYISPAYERVWKRSAQSLLQNAANWVEPIHADDRILVEQAYQSGVANKRGFEVEFRIVLPDGSVRHVLNRGFPVHGVHGKLIRMAGVASDITELYRARDALKTMAETDDLTGAVNSRAFRRNLQHELTLSVREGRPLAVALLDIDNFKAVNDEYGHLAGDAVLIQVVQALRGRLRTSDVVARIGGDEFCVVLPNADEEGAARVLFELASEISKVNVPLGAERGIAVTLSVGIAVSSQSSDALQLLSRADEALYKSKRDGRNRVSVAPKLALEPSLA